MPEYVALGYKRNEPCYMIDFHRQRGMVKTDASLIIGAVHLEVLPSTQDGRSPCMLLTSRIWKDIYLVNFRHGWDETAYFRLAYQLFEKRGILRP